MYILCKLTLHYCSTGAAIVAVNEYAPPTVFSSTYHNSRCLLQYSDPTIDLTTLKPNDVRMLV